MSTGLGIGNLVLRLYDCTAACVSAVWRRQTVSPYFAIEQIIFHFLCDHSALCGIFENGVLLMYTLETLESVSSVTKFITAYEESLNKTETPIF